MSLPVDMNVMLDASRPATFTCSGVDAGDRGLVDAVGSLMTQATAASQPTYCEYCGNGPGIIFGGNGAPKFAQPTFLSVGSFTFQIPFSLTIAMRGDGVATAAELSTNVASARGVLIGTDTTAIKINGPSGLATFAAAAGWNSSNVPQILTLTCDGTKAGTTLTSNVNGAVTLTPSGSDPGTGSATITGFVGQDHAAATPLTGSISFLGFIPGRVQTGPETTAIAAYIAATNYFSPGGAVTRNTICIGDSLTVGFQTQASGAAAYGFYQRALALLGSRMGTPNNNGVGGVQLTSGLFNVLSQWTVSGVGQLVSGKPNVVVVEGGTNDISGAAPTSNAAADTIAFTTATNMATVVQAVAASMSALAGGPHTIEVQTLTLCLSNGFQQNARKIVNRIMRARYSTWGNANVNVRLVDVGLDAALSGNLSVSTQPYPYYYVGEATHPAKPGQERWAFLLAQDILAAGL